MTEIKTIEPMAAGQKGWIRVEKPDSRWHPKLDEASVFHASVRHQADGDAGFLGAWQAGILEQLVETQRRNVPQPGGQRGFPLPDGGRHVFRSCRKRKSEEKNAS